MGGMARTVHASPSVPFWHDRHLQIGLWLLLFPLLAAMHFYAIRFGLLRLAIVLTAAVLWTGLVLLFRSRSLRMAWIAITVGLTLWLALPGAPIDAAELRIEYPQALARYLGTRYVWGGENARGIDCSGLVRAGMIDALFAQGVHQRNPRAIRGAMVLWWDDCSARALGEQYHGRTRVLREVRDLNSLDNTKMMPGDFAVTTSGVHTLAYLGDGTWIEADPSLANGDGVVEMGVPSANPWFRMPMHIVRWRYFEPS